VTKKLTQEDQNFIWNVVNLASQKAGSHTLLFHNKDNFFDEYGRIVAKWPDWLLPVRGYLIYQYNVKHADSLLIPILREVMSEANFAAYGRNNEMAILPKRFSQAS